MLGSSIQISDARRRLSALVERVARGGAPVAIGRYGTERAVLIGADEYARLTGSTRRGRSRQSLEGTLTLTCSPADLVTESPRIGELWLGGLDDRPSLPPRAAKRRRARRS